MAAGPPGTGPPGLGPTSGPPAEPPPPAPPGLWQQQAMAASRAAGADDALEKQKEISGTIALQVQRLLEQARLDTENKVKMELKTLRDVMLVLDSRLDQMIAQLDNIEAPTEATLDAEHVGQLLSKIEQQWGHEIRTLKEELHQTILAHNHNADLIKHHKDTIDALRERCNRLQSQTTTRSTAEILAQLARLEQLPKQQTQRKMEPLFERLGALERKVAAAVAQRTAAAAWRYPGMGPMPMMPPGVGVRPPLGMGMPPAAMMMGMGAAAGLMTGKGAGLRPSALGRLGVSGLGAAAGIELEEDPTEVA